MLSVSEDENGDEKPAAYIVFACVLTPRDLTQLAHVNPDHLWILKADGEILPIASTDEGAFDDVTPGDERAPEEADVEFFQIDSDETDSPFEDELPPSEAGPDVPSPMDALPAAENAKPAAPPTPDAKVAPPHPSQGSHLGHPG